MPVRTAGGATVIAFEYLDDTDGFARIDRWDGSTADYGVVVDIRSLRPGDCYTNPDAQLTAILMWCGVDHPWEVVEVVPTPDAAAGGEVPPEMRDACAQAAAGFDSESIDGTAIDWMAHPPSHAGDVVCAVFAPGSLLAAR